jgi:hypothetical protein
MRADLGSGNTSEGRPDPDITSSQTVNPHRARGGLALMEVVVQTTVV